MDGKDKRRMVLCLIFALILILRLINITNPPLDYSSWRQVDTDSIARNFVEYGFNIFYPQLNYDGPMPNYVQLEFQVTTFIIALFYKWLGYSAFIGRMVPVIFFMGSCWYLYLLAKRTSGINAAMISVLFYGIFPLNVIYSRNIMPESALMLFTIGALYHFFLWTENEKIQQYILALCFTTLAILTKLPAALIGIPMIFLSVQKYKAGVFKKVLLYGFPLIGLGLPFLYFRWLGTVAEQNFVSGIGSSMILPNFFSSIFKENTVKYLGEQFAMKVFTIPGIILFAVGAVTRKRKQEYFYYAWLLCAALHVVFVDAVIHLDYYLMFITPVIALFMGMGAGMLFTFKRYQYFLYIAIAIIGLNNAVYYKGVHRIQDQYITLGNFIDKNTEKDDLIIIDRDSPEIFYTSGRKGWRLYGEGINEKRIQELIDRGASYFVVSDPSDSKSIMAYLDKNHLKVNIPGGYYMYKLEK